MPRCPLFLAICYKFVQRLLKQFHRKASCRDALQSGFCADFAQWFNRYPGKSRFVTKENITITTIPTLVRANGAGLRGEWNMIPACRK